MNDEALKIMQEEPVHFIEAGFDCSLWEKQKQIVESVRDNKYTSVKSCHDIGKSWVSARIVLWFLNAFQNSKVITTAPTFKQVEDILWREIGAAWTKRRFPSDGILNQTSLELGREWFALGLSTNEPSRFQGYHAEHILLLIDEAAGVKQDIFDASEGIVSSDSAKTLYLGNPTSLEGQFYKSFTISTVNKIHISAFDTPNFTTFGITLEDIRNNTWEQKITKELPAPYLITPAWVYDKLLRWGEGTPMWEARVMGEFPAESNDTLIPLGRIEQARMVNLDVQEEDEEKIGADFARFGSDKTEYAYRKGPKVLDWKTLFKVDTIANAGELKLFMDFHPQGRVNGDEGGLGVGIMDMVKDQNEFKEVNFVNSASEPNDKESFINLRAEMYWGLRERFMSGSIDLSVLPQDVYDDLAAQLANIKYKFNSRGQRQIESKEDMKKRGLPSPDKADALALCFANITNTPSILDYMKGFK